MILRKEITTVAAQKGVLKSTIDKDWALNHFIDAVFSVTELKQTFDRSIQNPEELIPH